MLELGAAIGRQHAHDVVYDAAQAAFVEGKSFGDLLAADRARDRASRCRRRSRRCSTRRRTPGCARRWRARRRSGRGRRSRPSLLENPRRRRISGFRSAACASMPRRKQMRDRNQWLAWTSWPPPSAAPMPRFWASNMRAGRPTRARSIRASPTCSARMNDDARAVLADATGASWAPRHPEFEDEARRRHHGAAPRAGGADVQRAGARRHHRLAARADADPLLSRARPSGGAARSARPADPRPHAELDPRSYGFTDADLDRPIFIDNVLGRETATLREILPILRETYCGPIGVEFMHIQDPDQKSWIQRKVEGAPWRTAFDAAAKRTILHATDRGRGLRGVLPEALRHHQAVRPRGRRGHHPRDARDHRDRGVAPACGRSPSACRIAAG